MVMQKSKSLSYFKEYGLLYSIAYLVTKRLPKFVKCIFWNLGIKLGCYDKFIIASHGSGNNAISYFLKNSNALILADYTGDGKDRYYKAISKMYNKDTKIVYLNCFYDNFSKYIDLISGKKPSMLMLTRDPISNLVTNCNVKFLHKDSFRLGDDLESFFDNLFVYHGYSIARNEYITNHHPTLDAVLLFVKSEINYKNNDIRNIFERPPRFQYFENTLLNLFKDKNISIIDMKDLAHDKITDTLRFISELFDIEFRDNIYTKKLVNFFGSINIDCGMYRAGGGGLL